MFFVVFFVLGLGGAHACCPPEVFQIDVINLSHEQTEMFYYRMAHDDHAKLEGVVKLDETRTRVIRRYIKDFNRMVEYVFEPEANPPTCKNSTVILPFITRSDCLKDHVPGSANKQFYGASEVGSFPNSMEIEVKSFEHNRINHWSGMALDKKTRKCFPLYHRMQFLDNEINMAMIGFRPTDYVWSPDIFTIPSYCLDTK